MKIQINDREIELKYSFRALIIYENIQNKTFAPQTMTDVLVFFFCTIVGSDRDVQLSFDDFLDMIDQNPNLVVEFSEWLTNELNKDGVLESKDEGETFEADRGPVKKNRKTI